jgi:HemY protein
MINLLLFLFFIACASLAATFVVENPGTVEMRWFDYQIETSVAFIIFAILATAILIVFLTLFIRLIFAAPSRFFERRNVKQLKEGITELTYSISALASSNIDAAQSHIRKVEKLLGNTPLTILLSAQIAKTKGDEAKTQKLLEQLLEYKETEYLAARSLSDSANKQDNLPKALLMAKKAQAIDPKNSASGLAVISLQTRLGHWDEALANIQPLKIPRLEKNRIRALILLERGKYLLENGREEEALALIKNIISVLPKFPPALIFCIEVYDRNQQVNKSKKLRSRLTQLQHDKWLCKSCGHVQDSWKLHCEACAEMNSLEQPAQHK